MKKSIQESYAGRFENEIAEGRYPEYVGDFLDSGIDTLIALHRRYTFLKASVCKIVRGLPNISTWESDYFNIPLFDYEPVKVKFIGYEVDGIKRIYISWIRKSGYAQTEIYFDDRGELAGMKLSLPVFHMGLMLHLIAQYELTGNAL